MEKGFAFSELNNLSDVKFITGESVSETRAVISKVAPMGKIAFITLARSHEKYSGNIVSAAAGANCKIISFIMPEPVNYSVEYAAVTFNIPEDVRAVLTLDRSLYKIASYFAAVKNLPLIYIPVSACAMGLFEKYFYLKNGERIDKVRGAENVYVVVDENAINAEIPEAYAFNMARLTTLIDYRVVAATGETIDAATYSYVLAAVKDTYNVLSEKKVKRAARLLYNGFKIALSDRNDNFSFISRSSERAAACLFCGGLEVNPQTELFYALKLIELYSAAFGIGGRVESFPNYRDRAEKIAAALRISQGLADEILLENVNAVSSKFRKAVTAMNNLKGETEGLLAHAGGVINAYYALGGKRVDIDGKLLVYAGDLPFGINAASFLREAGVLDL